jgi:hypothetical protein
LAFSLALARPFGILGVAMGTLIGAFVIRVVVLPWWVCKVSGIPYAAYMRFFAKTMLYCTSLMCAAIAIVAWGLRPSYPFLIGSAICATAIYAVGSWVFVFTRGEREQFAMAISNRSKEQTDVPAIVTIG